MKIINSSKVKLRGHKIYKLKVNVEKNIDLTQFKKKLIYFFF